MRRAIASVLLISLGFAAGMIFPANNNELTINMQDGEVLGGTVAKSFFGSNRTAEEMAQNACGSQINLRNFEITHAIATTSVYRFDCVEPGKDTQ